MSLENDITIIQEDMFKPASKSELKTRAVKAREIEARDSIIQVRKHRYCSICGNDLVENEWYLKVKTAGNYAGGTVCRTCLNIAANEIAKKTV